MAAKKNRDLDQSTEDKIKQAAKTIFHKKGFAAARTRDIAEEAGINLALLNYYFRSKERLFQIVMLETLENFMRSLGSVFNDATTSLRDKLRALAERYIDLLLREPDVPIFILNEMRSNAEGFFGRIQAQHYLGESVIMQQLLAHFMERGQFDTPPMQYVMSFMSLIVFPFAARPLLQHVGRLSEEEFTWLMEQRKQLIPYWIGILLDAPPPPPTLGQV